MNLLVMSPLSFPALDRYLPDWSRLDPKHRVSFNECHERPDAIVCMSISRMEQTFEALRRWPHVPLFVYHWDCYSWIWTRPRANEYDYRRYGDMLLKRTHETWVPSRCTALQTREWWDVTARVIHPSAPTWDDPDAKDEGYALCTLRELPDECAGWFEQACIELKIPYHMTDHRLPYSDYQKMIAGCRLIVSHYKEASTGGLSLLEAYHLGKRVLISGSPWNGANEYFGDRAFTFPCNDYDAFKEKLHSLWQWPGSWQPPEDCKEWVEQNFSDDRMANQIMERIDENLG